MRGVRHGVPGGELWSWEQGLRGDSGVEAGDGGFRSHCEAYLQLVLSGGDVFTCRELFALVGSSSGQTSIT